MTSRRKQVPAIWLLAVLMAIVAGIVVELGSADTQRAYPQSVHARSQSTPFPTMSGDLLWRVTALPRRTR
ncbi:MAG TPA: hypothetical protein VJ787_05675, partial [Thermoleophilia bacterium]|nr:hypothetical protein [Thermoleophilia bacterium]